MMHQIVSATVDSSRRWWVLAIVVAAQFMFGVDAFIVNVAIPTIAVELHASPAQIEAVIAIYPNATRDPQPDPRRPVPHFCHGCAAHIKADRHNAPAKSVGQNSA